MAWPGVRIEGVNLIGPELRQGDGASIFATEAANLPQALLSGHEAVD